MVLISEWSSCIRTSSDDSLQEHTCTDKETFSVRTSHTSSLLIDRFVKTSPLVWWTKVLLIHRGVSGPFNNHSRRCISLWARRKHWFFLRGVRVWATGRGAFPISKQQTHRYTSFHTSHTAMGHVKPHRPPTSTTAELLST